MSLVIVAIIVVWGVLFAAAYLSRVTGGRSRRSSVAVVTGSYLVLGFLALSWFGFNRTGFLGAFGMLLPYAAATGMVMISPRRRDKIC